jgi:OOP family OmpA-OmpF porin
MGSIDIRRLLARLGLFCLVATATYLGAAPLADADTATGGPPPVAFDIPAQSLSSALNTLAIQANLQMFFEESTVKGLQSPAVQGEMSVRDALHTLLAGTRLEASQNADGTYVIRNRPPAHAKARPATPPPAAEAPPPAAVAAAAPPPLSEFEQEGPWMARLRAEYVDPANRSDAFGTAAPGPASVPRNGVLVNGRMNAEADLEYFFTPHISTELSLAVPRQHSLNIRGTGISGSFDWMPNTWTLKYDFLASGPIRPYIGAGVGITNIYDSASAPLTLSSTSIGPAAQAGLDLRIGPRLFLNADVRWAQVRPELRFESHDITEARFDPMIYSLGIGYRFGGRTAGAAPAPRAVLDSDGDGVPDDIDQCPNTPHGVAVDAKGCPIDSDHDGVPDYLDKCPNTPPGVQVDEQGCPLDSDHDGVPDYLDKCPGTPPGLKVDANGCEIEELVLKGVNFETASAKLTADSTAILDGVVAILKMRPNARAEIHGYTDSVGGDAYNLKLSERRAKSVMDYLVEHGIAADGLSAKGFGKADPLASNSSAEGRAQNRRVTVQFKGPVAR